MKIQQYNVQIHYKTGSTMHIADTLSRAYLPTNQGQQEFEQINYANEIAVRPDRLERIKMETEKDPALSKLINFIINGWPQHSDIPSSILPYSNFKEDLSVSDGIIFKGDKIVVPVTCRLEMKKALHASHRATDACIRRAHQLLYWPAMNSDIKQFIQNCFSCQAYAPANQREPLIPHPVPSHAWNRIGVDIFYFKTAKYLIVVDHLTDYFEIERLDNETTETVISKLKQQFARYGIPLILISDNGPCLKSYQFKKFSQSYDFQHQFSSAYHQQANGKAENAVKQAKNLLKKSSEERTDPFIGLLELRNTPDPHTGLSPAKKFHCRMLRSTIPAPASKLKKGPASITP